MRFGYTRLYSVLKNYGLYNIVFGLQIKAEKNNAKESKELNFIIHFNIVVEIGRMKAKVLLSGKSQAFRMNTYLFYQNLPLSIN